MSAETYTVQHGRRKSRLFVIKDKNSSSFFAGVLYHNRSLASSVISFDLKHFMGSSKNDAIEKAKKWIKEELGGDPKLYKDKKLKYIIRPSCP